MVSYEISNSAKGVSKAYALFMDKLSEHVIVLARNGKPITSVMATKRALYRYRQQFISHLSARDGHLPPEGRIALTKDMELLVGDVLDKFDVDVLEAVNVGLIGEKELKRVLIMYYYEQMAKQGLKYKEIKQVLSERYGFSVSSIEKLVYR